MQSVKHAYADDVQVVRVTLPQALIWASSMLNSKAGGKRSAVFDIDDTLIREKDDQAMTEIVNLYRQAQNNGVRADIVTARPHEFFKETRDDLDKCAIEKYASLSLLPPKYEENEKIELFKWRARGRIERENNCSVALNIGDQWTDHFGHSQIVDELNTLPNDTYVIVPQTAHGRRSMHSNLSVKLQDLS
jgi:hypothetical protein